LFTRHLLDNIEWLITQAYPNEDDKNKQKYIPNCFLWPFPAKGVDDCIDYDRVKGFQYKTW